MRFYCIPGSCVVVSVTVTLEGVACVVGGVAVGVACTCVVVACIAEGFRVGGVDVGVACDIAGEVEVGVTCDIVTSIAGRLEVGVAVGGVACVAEEGSYSIVVLATNGIDDVTVILVTSLQVRPSWFS